MTDSFFRLLNVYKARTLPYPALHTDDVTEYKSMALSNDPRIPYDVLVNIRDRIPTGGPDRGIMLVSCFVCKSFMLRPRNGRTIYQL